VALSDALPGDRAVQLPAVRKTLLLAGVDTLAIIGGFLLVLATLELRPGFTAASQLGPERFLIDGMIVGGLVLFFRHTGHYTERRPFWQETGEVVTAFAVALLVAAAAMFFAKLQPARLLVLGYWTVGCVMLLALRWLTKSWLIALGRWAMPAVIVGTRRNARDLAVAMLDDPIPSYRPVAFVALAADAATPTSSTSMRAIPCPCCRSATTRSSWRGSIRTPMSWWRLISTSSTARAAISTGSAWPTAMSRW
jgi:hypothetical protein